MYLTYIIHQPLSTFLSISQPSSKPSMLYHSVIYIWMVFQIILPHHPTYLLSLHRHQNSPFLNPLHYMQPRPQAEV